MTENSAPSLVATEAAEIKAIEFGTDTGGTA